MTAVQALQHPFLTHAENASTVTRHQTIANLKTFNAKRKWKSIADMVIATNRLKMLSGISQKRKSKEKTFIKKGDTKKSPGSPKSPQSPGSPKRTKSTSSRSKEVLITKKGDSKKSPEGTPKRAKSSNSSSREKLITKKGDPKKSPPLSKKL